MPFDPYSSCPCGSGKKFKWCCQPIHLQMDRAFQQDAAGQHEAALKIIDEVIAENPANPEALGRKALLLHQNHRIEEAEKALHQAFAINPRYAFGHLLRGLFRYQEGEIPGALLLFRKAAEYYDPQAHDPLSQVYGLIADCEMKMNRPVASKAALQVVLTCRPSDDETRENFQALFGDKSRLPLSVRRDYAFRKPTSSPGEERRGAWDRVLAGTGPGRFHDAVRAFQELTQADGQDASAWYNLALARAWLGENAPALEALDRYVALETDPAQAGEAWALAEVLRLGQGLEDQSDHLEYSVFYQIRDPRYLENLLQDWDRGRRLIQVPTAKEERNITVLILDTGPVVTAVPGLAEAAPLGAYVSIFLDMNLLHLWSPLQEGFQRVRAEVEQRAGPGLAEPHSKIRNSSLGEIVTEAVVFPVGIGDVAEANRRVRLRAEQFFEETWVHRPLRSLNGIPPLDAAGHAVLRKKLCGVVQFLQEASVGSAVEIYDFDRLRRKLGLLEEAAATAGTVPADISALGASELAALAVESLSDQQLEQAFQTAQRLDAQELSTRFAQALIGRPPQPDNPDRFPWYAFLVQHALGEGRTDEALGLIGAGEQADQEHNAGRRHSDYELRRGQIHARRGEVEAAQDVFSRLNQRDPENMKNWAAAAEAMLALKQGPHALRFAEEGIAQARKLNDRDSEKYLMELAEAARRVT